jgi:hypothetical protein
VEWAWHGMLDADPATTPVRSCQAPHGVSFKSSDHSTLMLISKPDI